MGALQRRQREKAEFREEVLRAARAIVLEEGFGALSMRKIAEAIEYSPGTIYLYFESRDAIAYELCEQGFEEFFRALSPAAGIADPAERLRKVAELYVRFGLEHPETYRLIFMSDAKFTDAGFKHDQTSAGMRALGLLVTAFDEVRKAKRLRTRTASAELADAFWAIGHGVVSLKLTLSDHPETPIVQLARTVQRIFLDGVLKE